MARRQYMPLHRISNDHRGGPRGGEGGGRMMSEVGASVFQSRVIALDGLEKVTGAARFTFDVTFPGILHAKVLRSPHPHARIVAIDTSRAEALAGVVAIVTGGDGANFPVRH